VEALARFDNRLFHARFVLALVGSPALRHEVSAGSRLSAVRHLSAWPLALGISWYEEGRCSNYH
jgi:hypothetical protein